MFRNIASITAKAALGLAIVCWAAPSDAWARGHGSSHGGSSHGSSHHSGSGSWNHGGNWNHGNNGYYRGGYYGRGLPFYGYGGYGSPYRGGYYGYDGGYYPSYDYSYPDYGYPNSGYDQAVVTGPVEPARINIRVPSDARVAVNGVPMAQTGPVRQYVSAPLEAGYQYSYDIRASWMTPAGPVNNSRTVWVNPGDNVTVNLNMAPSAPY
jgi:uncharacterized protein (TIGR03000 family)